jgi:protein TonB
MRSEENQIQTGSMKRSTAALLIAVLFHLLVILLFWLLSTLATKLEKSPEPEEHRIKVSLKDRPETGKDAVIEKKQKQPEIAPPMPKGKQLEKLVEKSIEKARPEPKPLPEPEPPSRQPVKEKEPRRAAEKTKPLPPEKARIPLRETAEANRTKPVKKESERLYALLSKKVEPAKNEQSERDASKRRSRIGEDIKEAYGTTFGELSEGEQKYILDNQEIMRRITQQVLNRVGRVNIPSDMRINSYNIIEFYLYPNGDISDIKFIKRSGFYILDDTTKETIEYAYSKYPRPEQKTRIRYKVGYYLRGY